MSRIDHRSLGYEVSSAYNLFEDDFFYQPIYEQSLNCALIIETIRGGVKFVSSAVAIDAQTILTCAHSLLAIDKVSVIQGQDYSSAQVMHSVHSYYIHAKYQQALSNYQHDIGVVFLDSPLSNIQFPKLVSMQEFYTAKKQLKELIKVGFGFRGVSNKKTVCFPFFDQLHGSFNFTCFDETSVKGDSGAPVFLGDRGDQLLGIHSTLEANCKTYSVFLPTYIEWITQLQNFFYSSIQR